MKRPGSAAPRGPETSAFADEDSYRLRWARRRQEAETLPAIRTASDAWNLTDVSRMVRLLLHLGTRFSHGGAIVELRDGRRFAVIGEQEGPIGIVRINDDRMAKGLLLGGGVGWGECFVNGDYDADDIFDILWMAALNEDVFTIDLLQGTWLKKVINRIGHALSPNTTKGSQRNIASHYDLGNAFYETWLDAGMTYSAALFENGANSLEAAQVEKYRQLSDLMGVAPEHHVLEVGCGWGAFAEFLGRDVGCRVNAITISREQHDYAAARIQREGLAEKVRIELRDYRDIEGRFDRIASIEMIEAVGEKYWPVFFEKLRAALRPDGRIGLQAITIADRYFDEYRSTADFIQRYIFPGGMLLSPSCLRGEIEAAGLRIERDVGFGAHYARTLSLWRQRFHEAWPQIEKQGGFDERFRRLWEYYLAYCDAGFRVGFTDVRQLALNGA